MVRTARTSHRSAASSAPSAVSAAGTITRNPRARRSRGVVTATVATLTVGGMAIGASGIAAAQAAPVPISAESQQVLDVIAEIQEAVQANPDVLAAPFVTVDRITRHEKTADLTWTVDMQKAAEKFGNDAAKAARFSLPAGVNSAAQLKAKALNADGSVKRDLNITDLEGLAKAIKDNKQVDGLIIPRLTSKELSSKDYVNSLGAVLTSAANSDAVSGLRPAFEQAGAKSKDGKFTNADGTRLVKMLAADQTVASQNVSANVDDVEALAKSEDVAKFLDTNTATLLNGAEGLNKMQFNANKAELDDIRSLLSSLGDIGDELGSDDLSEITKILSGIDPKKPESILTAVRSIAEKLIEAMTDATDGEDTGDGENAGDSTTSEKKATEGKNYDEVMAIWKQVNKDIAEGRGTEAGTGTATTPKTTDPVKPSASSSAPPSPSAPVTPSGVETTDPAASEAAQTQVSSDTAAAAQTGGSSGAGTTDTTDTAGTNEEAAAPAAAENQQVSAPKADSSVAGNQAAGKYQSMPVTGANSNLGMIAGGSLLLLVLGAVGVWFARRDSEVEAE